MLKLFNRWLVNMFVYVCTYLNCEWIVSETQLIIDTHFNDDATLQLQQKKKASK